MARGWVAGEAALQFDPNGGNSASNGLSLFFCQLLIILSLCFILGTAFKFVGQPKVVGELLAGVVLGPTAFGNIPGFSQTIVPPVATPLISIAANVGLVFFILIVGLETDTEMIQRHARKVALIALPGMAVPFAISVGLAKFIYEHSTDQSQAFTTFFLFVSTVMAVTSLSVLSRIVSEMQIVNTLLGSITIAAGALNDLIGYILLALGSALAGGGKQINALYQLLVALALFACQWFVVRPLLFSLIRRSTFDINGSSKQRVPEHLLVFTLVGTLISSFITEACGLHPILGSLLFGIACPHGNFAVMVTEEIETVAVQILLPLYFVNSGLKADFKLLNTGLIWGELFMVVAVVFISKFATTALATRIAGFNWLEASFVASLMQSKSIIELIILNAGREAGVLNAQVYSMLFVTFILSTLTVRPLAVYIWRTNQGRIHRKSVSSASHDNPTRDDEKRVSTGSEEAVVRPTAKSLSIIAALTSANPAMEPLTALMQLCQKQAQSTQSVAFDFVRFLPSYDNSSANILRQLHQHGDQVLDAVKLIAMLKKTACIQREKSSGLLTVSNEEEVIKRLEERVQIHRDNANEALIVVPWDANAARLAPFATDTEGKEQRGAVSWTSLGKASTMAGHLFGAINTRCTAGVLVESSKTIFPAKRLHALVDASEISKAERELGLLDSPSRRPRVIIPFFGGSDDRECVELARKFAEQQSADVIVVKVDDAVNGTISDDLIKKLQDEQAKDGTTMNVKSSARENEEANLITVNLRSVNLDVERHADARALFGEPAKQEEISARPTPSEQATAARSIQKAEDGIVYVTLCSSDVQSTATKTCLEGVLAFSRPLLVAQAGDVVFVGRGKWQQRMASFRVQLNAIQEGLSFDEEDQVALSNLGRVLGSSCEAVLTYGLDANMLVLQSKVDS